MTQHFTDEFPHWAEAPGVINAIIARRERRERFWNDRSHWFKEVEP